MRISEHCTKYHDHEILLKKVESFGIEGLGLEWLKIDCLDDDIKSSMHDITCGVPQESIWDSNIINAGYQ